MRDLKNSGLVHDIDYSRFPNGAIKNETDTDLGTPVVREVYNDLLSNFYKLLNDRKVAFNQLEDNELNGYQIIQALKKLTNEINDKERILSFSSSKWNVDIDFDLVPDKYFFFARSGENFNPAVLNQTIKGTGTTEYQVQSSGFSSGDMVLVILDHSVSRIYKINQPDNVQNFDRRSVLNKPMIKYSDKKDSIIYNFNSRILDDKMPKDLNVLSRCATIFGEDENDVNILDVFLIQDFLIFMVQIVDGTYRFAKININSDLSMSEIDSSIPNSSDKKMYAYFSSEGFIYLTNQSNNNINDFLIDEYFVNLTTNKLEFSQTISIDSSFVKTSNGVIFEAGILTLVDGNLSHFGFDGSLTQKMISSSFDGQIVMIDKEVFYKENNSLIKWDL